jgi:diguanylate cyclase (GGDEF)-like protein
MEKVNLRSILFIFYTLILAVVLTVYVGDRVYLLNSYMLPILFGSYYFDIFGGIGIAILSSVLSVFFVKMSGTALNDTFIIVQIVMFGIVGAVSGIFQRGNNKLHDYLFNVSLTDRLTGLYNYDYFVKRMAEEISRSERYKHPVGLIMIDIDRFKNFNDSYGHQRGNQVLVTAASIFRENIRQSDVAFRYGGEEFAIILPETCDDAEKVAEKLRKAIEAEVFPGNLHVTISAGVSSHRLTKKMKMGLVEQADKALYTAKESGRNRVCVYHERDDQ